MNEEIIGLLALVFGIWFCFKLWTGLSKAEKSKIRTCQYCGQKIPYHASVCPVCRCKTGTDFAAEGRMFMKMASLFWSIMKVVLIIVIVGTTIAWLTGNLTD